MQNKTQATACYSVLSDDFFSDDHWVVQDILSDEFFADDHWVTQDLFSDEFFSDDFWKTKKRKKNTVNPLDNETRNFLFDPTKNQYEKIRKSLVNYYKKKDLYYLAPADSAEDVVSEFLVHVCEKDKFKGNTETLKMGNVIYIFRQFLSRERMAKSKCGLYRSKDVKAKTDQEQRLEKEGKTLRKIAYYGIILYIINQGSFSYWRSWEEYNSPYLDDIGYTKVLAHKIAEECIDKPQIRFVSRHEIKNADEIFHYRFDPQFEELNKTGTLFCQSILVFQNKLLLQSPILSWYLQQQEPLKKMEIYNNQIWITGKQ
mgnify:CR=1 FL=1